MAIDSEGVHGGNIDEFARKYGFDPGEILDFSSNTNPLPLPAKLKRELARNFKGFRRYPDRDYHELRKALADYTGCSPDLIMVGNGATELLYLAVRSLRPEKTLVPAPSFSDYERAVTSAGMQADFYRIKEELDFKLDTDCFLRELAKGYSMTILCNPNNPTGYLIPQDELLAILETARRLNTLVLLDETFIEFVPNPDESSIIKDIYRFDNVILLRALTKFFGVPGLRLGYCLAHPVLLNKMRKFKEPWTVNAAAAILGPLLLREEDFIKKTREWIMKERPYMYKRLQKIEGIKVYESNSAFFLAKLLDENWSALLLQNMLADDSIMIRNAASFKYLDNRFFRLAIKNRSSNNKLLACLQYYL